MMVWSIETDDFHGICGRPFDLIKTLRETFTGGDIPTPPTLPTTTIDPSAPPTTAPLPPPDDNCSRPGINADPENCHHYYLCTVSVDNTYSAQEELCAAGTLFNPNASICDWEDAVCAIGSGICKNDCP
ncbi:Chitotriosidase-1-like 1 [Homarus americanus]|uniref:Chitotriosidase-1-like 1 n=2 Tax=Homarus americanus TaxID=6706 RepID=A0A8J5ND89_HOMAM|nr:Chitotriosidase-1-like 1 [Homarus americanus]